MYSIHICTVSIYMDGRVRFEGRYRFVYIRTHGWIHSRYTLYYGHPEYIEILLMEEILHQLVGTSSLSHYLQDLYIPGDAGFLPSTVPPPRKRFGIIKLKQPSTYGCLGYQEDLVDLFLRPTFFGGDIFLLKKGTELSGGGGPGAGGR